jgi:hypothetical protein
LAPGRYRIVLGAGEFVTAEAEITVRGGENTAVKLELTLAASILLAAKDATLPPGTLEGAGVEVFDAAGNVLHPFGRFSVWMGGPKATGGREIGPLAAGAYRVVVRAAGYAAVEGTITVKAGERATLTLEFKK